MTSALALAYVPLARRTTTWALPHPGPILAVPFRTLHRTARGVSLRILRGQPGVGELATDPAGEERVLDDLLAVVRAVPVERLPDLLGRIETVRILGLARLTVPAPTSEADDDRLLALPEVAEILAVPVEHARELGRRGALPTVRVGERYVRVRRSALQRFIHDRERQSGGARTWPVLHGAGRAAAFKQRSSA